MASVKDKLLRASAHGTLKFSVPGYNRELEPDQKLGAGFLCLNRRGILASPIGSGKTIEAVGALSKLVGMGRIKSFLVVTPVSVLGQWVEEINDFADLGVYHLTQTPKCRRNAIKYGDKRYLTTTTSLINDISYHLDNNYDCLILDESITVKHHTTAAWNAHHSISQLASYVFFLTAKPFENNLEEIYGQAEACSPGIIGTPAYFNSRYCNWQKVKIRRGKKVFEIPKIVSYNHIEEFKALVAPILLYRHSEGLEVPIKAMTVRVDMTPEQREIYDRLALEQENAPVHHKGDLFKTQGILLRAANSARFYGGRSSAKVDKIVELIQHPKLKGKKVLIYTHYYEMLEHIKEALEAIGRRVGVVSGKVDGPARERVRRSITTDAMDTVIITDAGREGIRLEAASVVILAERPWSPKALEQIVGRANRKGQKEPYVVVILILARNTREDYVTTVMSKKEKGAEQFYGFDTTIKGQVIKNLDELDDEGVKEKALWR